MDSTTSKPYTITFNPPKQYGWVCPLCGRANAPWVNQCPCKPLENLTWSSSEWTNTPNYTVTAKC